MPFPIHYRRTVVSNYLNTATQAFVALVMTPILARNLGTRGYGIWALVGSLVLYLELLEFGFAQTTVKYVSENLALGDRDGVRRTVATSVGVLSIPGLVALGLGVGLAAVFPLVFHIELALETTTRVLVVLLAVDLAVSIPSDTFGGVLMALQRYDLLNLTLVTVALAQSLSWVIVISSGGGLVALGIATVGLSLAGQSWRFLLARRLIPEISISRRFFDRTLFRPFARLSVWFALRNIAEVVSYRIDTIVVGLVVGVPAAGIYAVGQKLSLLVDRALTPLTASFFPYSAELATRRDAAGLRRTVTIGTRITLALAVPLCLTVALLSDEGVRAWVGPAFDQAAPVVVFLAVATAVKALTRTGLLALYGMGQAKVPATVFTFESILNLTLSVILGHTIGLKGVALATVIAASISELCFILPYMCKQIGLGLFTFLRMTLLPHLPALATSLGVGALLVRFGVRGLFPVLGAASAIFVAYISVFAISGVNSEERSQLLSHLHRRSRRDVLQARAQESGEPLRVLLVDPSPRGGIARYVAQLSQGLVLAGASPTLLACRTLPDTMLDAETVANYAILRRIPEWSWTAPSWRSPRFIVRRVTDWLSAANAVESTARAQRAHVIHFQAPLNRRFDAVLLRRLRRSAVVVVTAHDVLPPERTARDEARFSAIYRTADLVVVHNQAAAEELRQLCGVVAAVIEQPAETAELIDRDAARRRLSLPPDGRLLAALGFIRPYKGYDLLADVWEALGDQAPRLLVMGSVLVEEDPTVLERLERHPRVVMRLEYASDDELQTAMAAADALLLPYRSASGSGLIPLARAMGTPVLASDAPQLAEDVLAARAGVVLPRDIETWKAAVVEPLPPPPAPGPSPLEAGASHLQAYISVLATALGQPAPHELLALAHPQ